MRMFVIACTGLLVLAVGFQFLQHQSAALIDQILLQPLPQQISWLVILVAVLVLIAAALWLTQKLMQERKAYEALETRFRGVREGVNGLATSQKDADWAVNYLAETDPEHTIKSLQQRLANTEQVAQLQQGRNDASDLLARIEDIQNQQKTLREMLGGVIGKRRSVEQLFTELQRSQGDIDRMLADIEGDDGNLQGRLHALTQSINGISPRFDDLERSLEMLIQLKKGLGVLQSRLVPIEQNEHGGIKALGKTVQDVRDQLVARLDFLGQEGDVTLADRVAKLAETKQQLDARTSGLLEQYHALNTIHKDVVGIVAKLKKEINSGA